MAKGGRGGIYRRRRGQLVAATVGFGYWSLECVQCVFYPKSKHSNDNSVQKASNNHRRYTLRYTKSFEPVPTKKSGGLQQRGRPHRAERRLLAKGNKRGPQIEGSERW